MADFVQRSVDQISRKAMEQAQKAAAKAPVGKTETISEFQEAMKGTSASEKGLTSEQIGKALGLDKAPGKPGTPGDAILNNIEKSSSEYKDAFSNIQEVMNSSKGELSPSKLLQVQMYMTQITVMQEMMSKVANKLSQGLQQLFKNQ